MFPYGAQYYRTPNPPESEWENDFRAMAEHGFTIAKIWAMWNWMHLPGDEFDFSHFDRLFELAGKHRIKLVINTILENAPYWLIKDHPDWFYEASDGQRFEPIARPNTPGGGWPGFCLDNAAARAEAEKFLRAVGERYVGHPALWGYDVWNEVFFEPHDYDGFVGKHFCYCEGSKARFVEWLRGRYGSIDGLNEAWRRRYHDWAEVYPPRYVGGYPDWLDFLKFRVENQRDLIRWRIDILRSVDPKHPLASHGIAYTLHGLPTQLTNDFDIAPEVDQWGLSAFPMAANQHASDYFRQVDLVRSACITLIPPQDGGPHQATPPPLRGRGLGGGADHVTPAETTPHPNPPPLRGEGMPSTHKGLEGVASAVPFWQNELQGGQSVAGLGRSHHVTGKDIAFWDWMSFMCGAKGLMYWQYRPELLGQESPGYGLTRTDGTSTDRTEAAAWFAEFMSAHPELASTDPIKGDCAIVFLPESELFAYVADGKTDSYAHAVFGIYRALWNTNVQVDFCTIDRVGEYPLVFLPFPLMIESAHAQKLIEYVRDGGVLVSDAGPGTYTDHGSASMRVPGMGLDEVFGCEQDLLEYVPTLTLGDVEPPAIVWESARVACSVYQEKLFAKGGTVVARYADGTPAVIDHKFGEGKTRLIGTYPGATYYRTLDHEPELLIRDALRYAGVEPMILCLDESIKARMMRGEFGCFLWVLNTSLDRVESEVTLSLSLGAWTTASDLATGASCLLTRHSALHTLYFGVSLEPLTGAVYRLE